MLHHHAMGYQQHDFGSYKYVSMHQLEASLLCLP